MHFGSLLDLLEGAPESLEDDGGHVRRDDDKIGLTVSLGESMNENAARMLDFDEPNMLLGESNQAFSNAKTPFLCSRTRAMESILLELIHSSLMNGVPSKIWYPARWATFLAPTSSSSARGRAKPRGSPRPHPEGTFFESAIKSGRKLLTSQYLKKHSEYLPIRKQSELTLPSRLRADGQSLPPLLRRPISFRKNAERCGPVTRECSRPPGR